MHIPLSKGRKERSQLLPLWTLYLVSAGRTWSCNITMSSGGSALFSQRHRARAVKWVLGRLSGKFVHYWVNLSKPQARHKPQNLELQNNLSLLRKSLNFQSINKLGK